jgi:hypothetical protein
LHNPQNYDASQYVYGDYDDDEPAPVIASEPSGGNILDKDLSNPNDIADDEIDKADLVQLKILEQEVDNRTILEQNYEAKKEWNELQRAIKARIEELKGQGITENRKIEERISLEYAERELKLAKAVVEEQMIYDEIDDYLENNPQYKNYIQHLIDYGWNGEDIRKVMRDTKSEVYKNYKENYEKIENERKDVEQQKEREERSKKKGKGFNNAYAEEKQRNFRKIYNNLRDKIIGEQDQTPDVDYGEKNKRLRERQAQIREDIFRAINKIYANQWIEEEQIRKEIWKNKQEVMTEIKKAFSEAGLDHKDYVKKYRNINRPVSKIIY